MPFNSSTPVMYYNKDAFEKAGLDPEKAPETFEEIEEASKKIVKSNERHERIRFTSIWLVI